jgi:hypothetical protein
MNFFQKVSIISTEILAESEYRFCQISRRKMMHFLPTLSQKVGILSVEFFRKWVFLLRNFSQKVDIFAKGLCAKILTFCEIFSLPPPPLPKTIGNPARHTLNPMSVEPNSVQEVRSMHTRSTTYHAIHTKQVVNEMYCCVWQLYIMMLSDFSSGEKVT